MRLILEETNKNGVISSNKDRRITIEVNYNGGTISEVMIDIIKPALVA